MIVHAMLEFFYKASYTVPADHAHPRDSTDNFKWKTTFSPEFAETFTKELTFHLNVCRIADKYNIAELFSHVDLRAKNHIDESAFSATVSPEAVRIIYSYDLPNGQGLRDILVSSVQLHDTIIFQIKRENREWLNEEYDFSEFFLDCLHFANTRMTYRGTHIYGCPACTAEFVVEMLETRPYYYCPVCAVGRSKANWEQYKTPEIVAYADM